MTVLPQGQPVIAGAGLAGLMAALTMNRPCILLSPAPLGQQTASALAQGGLAAAISSQDSVEQHVQDTLRAGDGLCDPLAVRHVISQGPDTVEALLALGVTFDRTRDLSLDLHLEAAHSHPRIVHARGDGTGAAIMDALLARIRRRTDISILENATLAGLDVHDAHVTGVFVRYGGQIHTLRTRACVIATGGLGALYDVSTSPKPMRGNGLAIAARAGATLADMEFVQFHPTALATDGHGRAPLISEAVRGRGAVLVDETGARFTDEFAPRDQVARAISAQRAAGHETFLDARAAIGPAFPEHFPKISRACRDAGIDPVTMPIPVRPATHYHMGGITTDLRGRSSVAGLWACGEAACTGLHGANRLASNSLLEAFVTGSAVGQDLRDRSLTVPGTTIHNAGTETHATTTTSDHRATLSAAAGILRDANGLTHGLNTLLPHIQHDDHALVGALICHAALKRQESRGAHFRKDFPTPTPATARSAVTLADLPLPDRIPEPA